MFPCDTSYEHFDSAFVAPTSRDMQSDYILPLNRLLSLVAGLYRPPPGRGRIAIAFAYGLICHSIFAAAVMAMIVGMYFGMSRGLGQIPSPWNMVANAALLAQFPLMHSVLLTQKGSKLLTRLAPRTYGRTLSTTTYAVIASLQLLVLFALWTPSGTIWWQADGWAFVLMCLLYASAWMLLMKASFDAGAEVQSGALGWMSLVQNIKPVFPDMPTGGLFRIIRQPIYVAFALTLWTPPVWTPDQLAIAVTLTAYCLMAPRLKERRFAARYGDKFETYKTRVPYALPRLTKREKNG